MSDKINSPFELTEAELMTLRCLAKGMPKEDISCELGVKPGTIKIRIAIIREKLSLDTLDIDLMVSEAVRQEILLPSEVKR